MIFQSKQVKGVGRGHKIGFPTINLQVPDELHIEEGIYAVWIVVGDKTYKGALHYGEIPTFNQKEKTLEVHLIDVTDENAPKTEGIDIEVDVVKKLRNIKNFETALELAMAISEDVKRVKSLLK